MQIKLDVINNEVNKAIKLAKSHYENFPVLSLLLSKENYPAVAMVYKFARTADDIADNPDSDQSEKISNLDNIEKKLKDALNGVGDDNFYLALAYFIKIRSLSHENFFKLLEAFKIDSLKNRWQNFQEILFYCERSANPIGRIILELHNIRNEKAFEFSDKICTSLQLINFYQDIREDYFLRNRLYFALEDMKRHKVEESDFARTAASANLKNLIKEKVDQAEIMMKEGIYLLGYLPLKLKIHIKLTILGGLEIINKIKKQDYDTLSMRPTLSKFDYFIIASKLFLKL